MELAVVGPVEDPVTQKMLRAVFGRYLPRKVVACGAGGDLFLLKNRPQPGGRTTAYFCENNVCKAPVTTPEELAALLS